MRKKLLKLEDAFFPVELTPVYADPDANKQPDLFSSRYKKIPGFKAVRRCDNGKVYAVVRDSYELIPHEVAVNLGRDCFAQVFGKANADSMNFFNMRMSRSGSYCHIDFLAQDEYVYLNGDTDNHQEEWRIFLRISNSYNRTSALKFDIGFCRWICKNGLIFGSNSIEFKYRHNKSLNSISADFKLRYEAMSVVKQMFQDKISSLKTHQIEEQDFMPKISKILMLKAPRDDSEMELAQMRDTYFSGLIHKYCRENGSNAYALLNILTDYASHPEYSMTPFENNEDTLERRVGCWLMQYMKDA